LLESALNRPRSPVTEPYLFTVHLIQSHTTRNCHILVLLRKLP